MRTVEKDLTTSYSSPPGTAAMSNLLVPRWSRSSGMSSATRVRRCRPSLIAFQPSAHREHPPAAAPSSSRSGASRCGTRSLESSTPSTAHCASGLCAARMASARFLDLGRRHASRGRDLQELRVRQVGEARRHPRGGRHLAPLSSAHRQLGAACGGGNNERCILKLRRAHLPATPSGRTGTTPYLSWSVVRASAPRNCGHHCPWQVSR